MLLLLFKNRSKKPILGHEKYSIHVSIEISRSTDDDDVALWRKTIPSQQLTAWKLRRISLCFTWICEVLRWFAEFGVLASIEFTVVKTRVTKRSSSSHCSVYPTADYTIIMSRTLKVMGNHVKLAHFVLLPVSEEEKLQFSFAFGFGW